MKNEKKTISVVMCTYNGEKYIGQQLDSILQQTHAADEIIVQDDRSTDRTYEILQEYQHRYSHIHVYQNAENKGINHNFFTAFQRATGQYIAISDQDDIWEPHKLEVQIAAIGDQLMCGSRSTPFAEGETCVQPDMRPVNYSLLRQLFVGTIAGHTLLFSKELLHLLPDLTDIGQYRYYDVILTMAASALGSLCYVDSSLVRQRRHAHAATYSSPSSSAMNLKNIMHSLSRTWHTHCRLRHKIVQIEKSTLSFLQGISSHEKIHRDAILMLQLYTQPSFWHFLRLQWFCVTHYRHLFHSTPNLPIGVLRALYFPISLSDYFRFLSDDETPELN